MATEPCGLLPISPRDGNQSEWHRWQRVHWQYYTHADIHGLCRSLIILKLMAMIFPFACWLILVIIWLQQMYLYAFMFPDHTTSKTSGLHQCLWGSLCSFVGLSFCPSPGAWYADAKKDSCTVLQMQHVLKKVPKSALSALIAEQPVCLGTKSKHDCYTVPVYNGSLDGNSAVYGIGPKVSLPKRRICWILQNMLEACHSLA